MAWYEGNSNKQTHPVAQLAANDWGLYDMSGNVWEYTQDCFHFSFEGAPVDGSAWKAGDCNRRVIRGGAWRSDASEVQAELRLGSFEPDRSGNGFRVVRVQP